MVFVALSSIYYLPVLAGVRVFPSGDFDQHFFPFMLFHHAEISAGHLPLWNPYTFSGHPFLADIQSAVFYPISDGILLLTLPMTSAPARFYLLEVEVILHIAFAGAATYLLVSRIAGKQEAGVLAGICFAFSGYLTGYPTTQLAVIRTAVWLPVVLYTLDRALGAPRNMQWWVASGCCAAFAFFGGHAQTLLYIVYVCAAWIALDLGLGLFGCGRAAIQPAHVLGLGVFVVVSFGLASVQLIPALEFASASVRARVDYDFVSGGFPLQDTWQILLPGVFTFYSPLYIGIPGLLLATLAIAASLQRANVVRDSSRLWNRLASGWYIVFFGLLAVIALLLSYGEHGFLYALFYKFVPGWNSFRGQERAAFVFAFSLSALAGFGAARLPELPDNWRKRYALVGGATVVAAVYGFGMGWQLLGRTVIGQWRYVTIAGLTIAFAMAISLIVWLPLWSRRRSALLVALATLHLFFVNFGASSVPGRLADHVQTDPEVRALESAIREMRAQTGDEGRVYNEFRVYDDYGMRTDIEDVWGSSPLKLNSYAALFSEFPLDRLWRLTGVRHVLTWRKELFVPSLLLEQFPKSKDVTYLHRLSDVNPRGWIVERTLPQADDQALATLADHGVDLDTVAVVEPGIAELLWPAGLRTVSVSRILSNRLRIEAESEHGGLLVVAENWMPGWRVANLVCERGVLDDLCRPEDYRIDEPALFTPIRANLSFVGLHIPPGTLAFDLVYWPHSFQIGASISALTLMGIVVAIAIRSSIRFYRPRVSGKTRQLASRILIYLFTPPSRSR